MGVLDAAKKAGFPIKVAIVAGEDDVSDNPEMLNKPQEYAEYVVGALVGSRVAVGAPVVIVPPAGIGVAGPGAEEMRGVRTGTTGDALARTARSAGRDIAAKAGHPLPADRPAPQVSISPPQGARRPDVDFGALTPLL